MISAGARAAKKEPKGCRHVRSTPLLLSPPRGGADADDLGEDACEVTLIGEPACFGDFDQRMPRQLHHCLRPVDPLAQKPLMGRKAARAAEGACEVARGQAAFRCKLVE